VRNIDPIWESKYSKGHKQFYPWDVVVSFVFKNILSKKPKKKVRILELGFGTGSNLWFAAREGFSVFGIEGSKTAVSIAKRRFKLEKLSGDLRLGYFTKLPFKNDFFDLVIDRNSLCCVGNLAQKKTIDEASRVLKKGGKFLHCTYGKNHSSYKSGKITRDGLTKNIKSGSLTGVGKINFSSRLDICKKFINSWKLIQIQKKELIDYKKNSNNIHQEWIVVVEKNDK
jgi:SAM-dependent methyltransferase